MVSIWCGTTRLAANMQYTVDVSLASLLKSYSLIFRSMLFTHI